MSTVAVVIPTIESRVERLEAAVASVRAQDRLPDQIIVEPDPERTGAAQTRNRGLERVTADYVAWLDDDDRLLPNHISRLARVLDLASEIGLVYPIPKVIGGRDPTATSVDGLWIKPWRIPFGEEQANHLRNEGSFIPITHMVRTDLVRQIGGFPQPGEVRWIEDWGYLVNLLDIGVKFYHLPIVTWEWIIHDEMTAGGSQTPGLPLWDRSK